MANIRERNGSYEITVSCGYDIRGKQIKQTTTYKPDLNMTARQIEREVQRQAILFEEECKQGLVTSAVKFETLAEEWFENYVMVNLKSTTYDRYLLLKPRVYKAIGHLRLDNITTRHIQSFITALTKETSQKTGEPLKFR